ncbi:uncharacterized protein LOC121379707 [Gigantopelta aegis]|uniref:uncharacterized protein LOC121379707 n=1 Tax=Gigantopelta aegis TaxID=1735272 RepID=UPI001B88E40D|nr:uncharacterized protein LOC121379707 [Gigantopelta aegis]
MGYTTGKIKGTDTNAWYNNHYLLSTCINFNSEHKRSKHGVDDIYDSEVRRLKKKKWKPEICRQREGQIKAKSQNSLAVKLFKENANSMQETVNQQVTSASVVVRFNGIRIKAWNATLIQIMTIGNQKHTLRL